ncbi:hypothetical protein B0H11DRAFT_1954782 [Mycena galericulata]|nr:hypothetical protein B0H11DRAFT_1954782 [Mycena galericulata]
MQCCQGLGLAISLLQIVFAVCLLPLFPSVELPRDPGSCVKYTGLDTRDVLFLITLFSVYSSMWWILLIWVLRRGLPRAARAESHVKLLSGIAAFWIVQTAIIGWGSWPSSPFWTVVSSCAASGFTSDVKCAVVSLHVLLPFVNIVFPLATAWNIYRLAHAERGADKVACPPDPPEYTPAWMVADVWKLDGSLTSGNIKNTSSPVLSIQPEKDVRYIQKFPGLVCPSISTLYCLCFAISFIRLRLAFYLAPSFPNTPTIPTSCNDDKPPLSEMMAGQMFTFCTCFTLALQMASLLPIVPRATKFAGYHVGWLQAGAFVVIFSSLFDNLLKAKRATPFWGFVSSCAHTAFTESGKCAAVGLHLLLPFVGIIAFLATAWVIHRRACVVVGGRSMIIEVPPPPPKYVAAWTLATVVDLGIDQVPTSTYGKDAETTTV